MEYETVLISYNSKENFVYSEHVKCLNGDEYEDGEILYGSDNITTIVCKDMSKSSIKTYTKLLLKEVLSEQAEEIVEANKQLCEANRIYINVVNKLI